LKPRLLLCAKWSMPLSVTGCGWLQRRRSAFVRGAYRRDECSMIAVQLGSGNPLLSAPKRSTAAIERQPERAGILAADRAAAVAAQFQPLDSSIVSNAIPAFFIGRNEQGFWVARDVKGQIGGLFLLESSALSFARRHSRRTGCATIFPSERFELDLENEGNPFIAQLGSLMRLAMRPHRQTVALLGKMTEAVKRRLEDFHIL
jgi:hypothetical protein